MSAVWEAAGHVIGMGLGLLLLIAAIIFAFTAGIVLFGWPHMVAHRLAELGEDARRRRHNRAPLGTVSEQARERLRSEGSR